MVLDLLRFENLLRLENCPDTVGHYVRWGVGKLGDAPVETNSQACSVSMTDLISQGRLFCTHFFQNVMWIANSRMRLRLSRISVRSQRSVSFSGKGNRRAGFSY